MDPAEAAPLFISALQGSTPVNALPPADQVTAKGKPSTQLVKRVVLGRLMQATGRLPERHKGDIYNCQIRDQTAQFNFRVSADSGRDHWWTNTSLTELGSLIRGEVTILAVWHPPGEKRWMQELAIFAIAPAQLDLGIRNRLTSIADSCVRSVLKKITTDGDNSPGLAAKISEAMQIKNLNDVTISLGAGAQDKIAEVITRYCDERITALDEDTWSKANNFARKMRDKLFSILIQIVPHPTEKNSYQVVHKNSKSVLTEISAEAGLCASFRLGKFEIGQLLVAYEEPKLAPEAKTDEVGAPDITKFAVSELAPTQAQSPNGPERLWAIALGEGGRLWNECQEQGVIAIGWDDLGDLSKYPDQSAITQAIIKNERLDHQPTNQSLCCWQFAKEMRPGDKVVVKVGRQRLVGMGTIESGYIYEPSRKEYHSIRRVKWAKAGAVDLPRDLMLGTKTLTDVGRDKELVEFVRENFIQEAPPKSEPQTAYLIDNALAGLFIPRPEFEAMLKAFANRKNLILQGPPGVGKTFVAKRLAYTLLGHKDDQRVGMVQFHQSYAYEDFIQGWRPTSNGGFGLKNGVFYDFCNRARVDLTRPYVFIIDEINRGNLSRIFGELMMLLEPDKHGADNAIPLTYSEGERFSVPENVHLLGLMNTADRSLAMVDYALRRRFRFVELRPQFRQAQFADHLRSHGAPDELVDRVINRMEALNDRIEKDHKNLGRGFCIGHSFFCLNKDAVADEEWYRAVILGELKPLIEEYSFEKHETTQKWVDELLNAS